MEEYINSQSYQETEGYNYNTETTNDTETASPFIDFKDLDATQRAEIEGLLKGGNNEQYDNNSNDIDYIIGELANNPNDEEAQAIKGFLSDVFDVDVDIIDKLNVYNKKEVRTFLYHYLKDWYYPSKEVEAFAEFVENGGNIQEFAAALAPIDFSQLSDEEAIRVYYANRMDNEALEEYISTLKNAGKLEKRAKEIKKEVGLVELSPDEILAKQKEMKEKQQQWLNKLKDAVSDTIIKLGLKFKNSDEREEFINLITEPKYHYNDNGQLEFIGSEYAYILNADIAALVISAYYLYNYDTEKKKQKAISETIDNIKRNLIQNRNLGIANFGL